MPGEAGGLPNFFIVGAPKCGTTSLADWLAQHPAIFLSTPKEPHFFSSDLANRNVPDWDAYRRLFRGVKPGHEAVGEASTWYLFSEVAVPAIEARIPAPRYIVMTRDPVDMAYSLYLHNVRHLHEDASTFEEAWGLQERRAQGEKVPRGCREPNFLQYRRACSLGSLVTRLLAHVPGKRVLHLPLEKMVQDPARMYHEVLGFLEIRRDVGFTPVFSHRNEARLPKNRLLHAAMLRLGGVRRALGIRNMGLLRRNEVPVRDRAMSEKMREELSEIFAEERRILATLAQRPEATESL